MKRFFELVNLYGLPMAIWRCVKAAIRRLTGFSWEKCLLMSMDLNKLPPPKNLYNKYKVREITLDDYDSAWSNFLNEEKRKLYERRLASGNAKAYGAFVEGKLAYVAWIQYGLVTYRSNEVLLESPDCAMLLDAYCLPQYRGRGLHNAINEWRLQEMKRNGVKKAYVIVLALNRPAIKTQRKCGMVVERTFVGYAFRHKIWNNYH